MQTSFEGASLPLPLADHPSWVRRAMLVEQLASRFRQGGLTPAERHATEDIFRVIVFDSEPLVRCVLADNLKRVRDISHDIIRKLARDEAQVARPVLQFSPVLGDDDLIRIARECGRSHSLAIAERGSVSSRLAEAMYRLREPPVLHRLLANDGAALPEGMLHAILTGYGTLPGIVEAMACRRILPSSVAARLAGYDLPENMHCERRRLAG